MGKAAFTLPHTVSGGVKERSMKKRLASACRLMFQSCVLITLGFLVWNTDWLNESNKTQSIIMLICVVVSAFIVDYIFDHAHRDMESKSQRLKTVSIATVDGVIELLPRSEWKAMPPRSKLESLKAPADHVIISHTADIKKLETTEACSEAVRKLQQLAFDMGFDDIAFNYLIGNDGLVYEGRGHSFVSATAKNWNQSCIGIGFLGKFMDKLPSHEALDVCKSFLQYLVDTGVLKPNFTIYGLCQVRPKFPHAPGEMLLRDIQTWKGIGPKNTWCWKSREESQDQPLIKI